MLIDFPVPRDWLAGSGCGILIPVVAPTTAQKNACINNLRQLDGAIQQYALEFRKGENDAVTLDNCKPYLRNSVICPAGGTTMADSYSVTDCKSQPTCISSGGGQANGHYLQQ